MPRVRGHFRADSTACSRFWAAGQRLHGKLPPKPERNAEQAANATTIQMHARELREAFLSAHAATIYDRLTKNRTTFLRAAELVTAAAKLVPGLVPTAKELAAERSRTLADKEGLEIDQGLLLSHAG
jgi:thioesterase DpgC